jgi:hypothetical protein
MRVQASNVPKSLVNHQLYSEQSADESALREFLARVRLDEVTETSPLSTDLARLDAEGFGTRLAADLQMKFPEVMPAILDAVRVGREVAPIMPPGPFDGLREAACRLELKGNEKAIALAVCEGSGQITLADLVTMLDLGWTAPMFPQWNSARIRLNKKLQKHGWRLETRDGCAVATPLKKSARK